MPNSINVNGTAYETRSSRKTESSVRSLVTVSKEVSVVHGGHVCRLWCLLGSGVSELN